MSSDIYHRLIEQQYIARGRCDCMAVPRYPGKHHTALSLSVFYFPATTIVFNARCVEPHLSVIGYIDHKLSDVLLGFE